MKFLFLFNSFLFCILFGYVLPVHGQEPLSESEKSNLRLLQEKVYLHTDKPYYYPGEAIWFKAYFSYASPALKDSLSKVLYVEWINSDHKIIYSSILKIEDGRCWGDIPLSKNIKPGEYMLRAYTNWMRNYGERYIFHKQITVFSYRHNVDPAETADMKIPAPFKIEIKPEKGNYKLREKVKLSISITNNKNLPVPANLSVSVTDAEVVVPPVKQKHIMSGALAVDPLIDDMIFQHSLEKGITVSGRAFHNRKPLTAPINIVQNNGNFLTAQSSEQGYFAITDLNYYDSMQFTFQPLNDKGRPFGKVEVLPRDIPAVNFKFADPGYKLRSIDMAQRVQNTYTTRKEVKLLKEVVVIGKAVRADSSMNERTKLYGKADYTVAGDNLVPSGGNFLLSLQGKVPGVRIVEYYDMGITRVRVQMRGGLSTQVNDQGPVILVDGMPFENANALVAIVPSMVDRVEVVTRALPQYGPQGTNGLIAIYTKSGSGIARHPDPNFIGFWVKGYKNPQTFPSPDYEDKSDDLPENDFRSTIYWNPNVTVDASSKGDISFFTADLPGRYRIVVEGLTAQGIPVKAEGFIVVD